MQDVFVSTSFTTSFLLIKQKHLFIYLWKCLFFLPNFSISPICSIFLLTLVLKMQYGVLKKTYHDGVIWGNSEKIMMPVFLCILFIILLLCFMSWCPHVVLSVWDVNIAVVTKVPLSLLSSWNPHSNQPWLCRFWTNMALFKMNIHHLYHDGSLSSPSSRLMHINNHASVCMLSAVDAIL